MIQPSYDIVVVTADLDSLINKLFFSYPAAIRFSSVFCLEKKRNFLGGLS